MEKLKFFTWKKSFTWIVKIQEQVFEKKVKFGIGKLEHNLCYYYHPILLIKPQCMTNNVMCTIIM